MLDTVPCPPCSGCAEADLCDRPHPWPWGPAFAVESQPAVSLSCLLPNRHLHGSPGAPWAHWAGRGHASPSAE